VKGQVVKLGARESSMEGCGGAGSATAEEELR
jgi:hypothetical protein